MQIIKINRFHTVKSLGVDWNIVNKMTIVTQRRTEIHPSAHSLRTGIISALRTTIPSCRLTYPFPSLRLKLSNLSEFMREITVNFARFYNRRHHRRGYFWGDRYKSVVVENGEALVNCLAYIDLNPLRARKKSRTLIGRSLSTRKRISSYFLGMMGKGI